MVGINVNVRAKSVTETAESSGGLAEIHQGKGKESKTAKKVKEDQRRPTPGKDELPLPDQKSGESGSSPIQSTNDMAVCGLDNAGNTCYLASVLQILRFTPSFYYRLTQLLRFSEKNLKRSPGNDLQAHVKLLESICNLFAEMLDLEDQHIARFPQLAERTAMENVKYWQEAHTLGSLATSPEDVQSALKDIYPIFAGREQQDAHEAVNSLINGILYITETLEKRKKSYPYFKKMFEGMSNIQTKCSKCRTVRYREEPFNQITIPIVKGQPIDGQPWKWIVEASKNEEKLTGDNKYHCETCGTLTDATLCRKFIRLPKILIFSLLRFRQEGLQLSKVGAVRPTPMEIPCMVCSSDNCTLKGHVYGLYGIVVHHGSTATCGHYVSYILAPSQERSSADASTEYWMRFDDEQVRVMTRAEIFAKLNTPNHSTYLLFYSPLSVQH